ncbi:hypothetical protein evm_002891 [Chilo suppressalis]|nr:hypothetical protein evm_002891 [Chilo suppressalis]
MILVLVTVNAIGNSGGHLKQVNSDSTTIFPSVGEENDFMPSIDRTTAKDYTEVYTVTAVPIFMENRVKDDSDINELTVPTRRKCQFNYFKILPPEEILAQYNKNDGDSETIKTLLHGRGTEYGGTGELVESKGEEYTSTERTIKYPQEKQMLSPELIVKQYNYTGTK